MVEVQINSKYLENGFQVQTKFMKVHNHLDIKVIIL